jgi:hypothetical protein
MISRIQARYSIQKIRKGEMENEVLVKYWIGMFVLMDAVYG